MKRAVEPGFILLTVFLLLSMATLIVTQIYQHGTLYNALIPAVVSREKAKQLALCGIPIAINQLALHDEKITVPESKKEGEKSKERDPEYRAKQLLKVLLTVQNQWQTFKFEHEKDGVEGTLKICITSQDGKIPLGTLIDYKKNGFRNNKKENLKGSDFFKNIFKAMKPFTKGEDLFDPLVKLIRDQKYELSDITELLGSKQFKVMSNKVFYEPNTKKDKQKRIFLTDLFRCGSGQPYINPFLFSPSVRTIFNLSPETINKPLKTTEIEAIVKKVSLTETAWEKIWNTYLQPIYKKDFKSLPKELTSLFSLKFEPRLFSVLCYGKVGQVRQKLVARIARRFTEQGEVFEVKKIYWL